MRDALKKRHTETEVSSWNNIPYGKIHLRQINLYDFKNNKEVFVKHEQAPATPKLEGLWFFCRFQIYFLRKPLFLANVTTSVLVSLTEMAKRHFYGPRPFIWAYYQVSMTFRSKVLACPSSSLEQDCPRTVCHILHEAYLHFSKVDNWFEEITKSPLLY